MLHDKSKKNNNRQWNNKTEGYKISNTDEMQLRIMIKFCTLIKMSIFLSTLKVPDPFSRSLTSIVTG
jgi:hypothetical protein